jgi:DNA invertase Pin-like site-specific DNA recombinase
LTATDDGITGTTMKRPGFQKMLTAIEAGYISAVFVKDYCAIIGLNQKDLENQGILA